ncbi:MAG: site-2 protease family protein [Natronomonas sp.]
MKSFRIGSAFGIPIRLDLTFLLVLPVFVYIIGFQLGEVVVLLDDAAGIEIDADLLTTTLTTRYGIGTAAAIGLFVSIVFHEYGHSLVARRYGVPIASITLWLLGGVAQMEEIPEDWKQEFNIAIAGPIVSVVTGVVSLGLYLLVPPGGFVLEATRFVLIYLAIMNVALAGFNLLPGFPMDGGRILRALLARNRPHAQATQQAARVGQVFAIGLGLAGIIGFNVFLVLLAFFVYIAAASESKRTVMNAAFEGITVADVMTPREELKVVTPDTSVAELTHRMFSERHTGYPVVERAGTRGENDPPGPEDRVVGIVTLTDAEEIREVERDAYRVGDVMSRDVHTVAPETPLVDAFETMQEHGIGRLLVVDGANRRTDRRKPAATGVTPIGSTDAGGETTVGSDDPDDIDTLVGLISRSDVMTALEIIKSSGSVESFGTEEGVEPDSETGADPDIDRGKI